ncbi:hypothetical protein J1N35_010482 [Gossypium stocksii]|uniref:CCHC-type domain-containing protein n=1 Tax=Gossypium stocksii TaxID=47602 RepID=A0A9D3W0H4_9ROSI|nr:hypothetical protein J1N35_010482 [Gossypium stocksii]
MESTVVLKLLGRNIGYGVLYSHISSLWNTSKPLHLMDIENGYFLVKLQSTEDYVKVLPQGPWLIYGQYLTVQPWTKEFNSSQPYPSMVLAWIRLPGLPGYLYKKKILEAIGETIDKVVRLDFNTDSRTKGRFTRMTVYINLEKPLIGQVLMNWLYQKVEYDDLPSICFSCGRYGHTKELCISPQTKKLLGKSQSYTTTTKEVSKDDGDVYGPWMVVERKSKRTSRSSNRNKIDLRKGGKSGTRFEALENMEVTAMEDGIIKAKEGQMAELNDIFKAERFFEQIRDKNRGCPNPKGKKQMGEAGEEFGHFNSKKSKEDGSNLQIKSNASIPKLIVVQVADSFSGLNPNKHSAVSFNNKGTVEGNFSKSNGPHDGGNKTRNMVKSLGNKDGGFRATKKINKITHGKCANFKSKNTSKIPLSDSMIRLTQSVSTLHKSKTEVIVPDSSKDLQN